MSRASKKPTELVETSEKVEPKNKNKMKEPKKKEKKLETDPRVLNKHIKERDKELAKIKMLVDKMVKVIE